MKTGFDCLAQTYDARIAGTGWRWTVGATIDSLKAITPLSGRVCDLGCGTGLYTRAMHDAGCGVWGVDFSFPMLLEANSRCGGTVVCADCRSPLPFGDGTFDLVTSFDTFTYVNDLDAVFLEAKRVLKEGGYFCCVVPNAASVVRALARAARRGSYATNGPREAHVFRKNALRKQIGGIFDTCGVTVVRPVPGFASGMFTRAPAWLKPMFLWEPVGLGLLGWGRKA